MNLLQTVRNGQIEILFVQSSGIYRDDTAAWEHCKPIISPVVCWAQGWRQVMGLFTMI